MTNDKPKTTTWGYASCCLHDKERFEGLLKRGYEPFAATKGLIWIVIHFKRAER